MCDDGRRVHSIFSDQVIDLSETSPEAGLDICRLLPSHSSHVLVCGGDGTVGWVLEAIGKSKLQVRANTLCHHDLHIVSP